MKIVYMCFGRAHSSVVASAIHLGYLDPQRKPTVQDLIKLPLFDTSEASDIGIPKFVGYDQEGCEVYILGLNGCRIPGQSAIESLAAILEVPSWEVLIVETLGAIGWLAKLGGFLSRQLHFVTIGRPIVAHGIIRCYGQLCELVESVKRELSIIAAQHKETRQETGNPDHRR